MIYLALPIGSFHGWGICGKNLGRELLQLTPVRYIRFNEYDVGANAFDKAVYGQITIDSPHERCPILLQAAEWDLTPVGGSLDALIRIGLVFADRAISIDQIKAGAEYWDFLIAGSTWSQQVLAKQGIDSTVVCQGVDPLLFNEGHATKQFLKDHFVVFSGGKFEYRKGQDLVIKAFQIFHEKHKDVVLITAWFNQWLDTMRTMEASPYIKFTTTATDYQEVVEHTLLENGIALNRALVLGPAPNPMFASVYQNSDVGVFPNRAENGTNLVLMEYMACGKPAIVSDFAGHKDVAHEENAILLRQIKPINVYVKEEFIANWGEPTVSDIVDRLKWAYHNRDKTALIGKAAGASMRTWTWCAMAEAVLAVVRKLESRNSSDLGGILRSSQPAR